LGITFIITGLMAIGFMSFGGMLTGGDEEVVKEEKTAIIKFNQNDKENVVSSAVETSQVKENKKLANNTKVIE